MKNPDVSREWVRIGVMLHAEPAEGAIDLESLIVRSLGCFRGDATFGNGNSYLGIAIVMAELDSNHAVQQGTLCFVDASA